MTENEDSTALIYVHDPMCSWCWGFSPTLAKLMQNIPENIQVVRILGGLAADSDEPMSIDMQEYLQQTWKSIEARIPGTQFNFNFWQENKPRRSTYPACRAVIAAREQGAEYDDLMTNAIQIAYYTNAKNPSDDSVLANIAQSIGLDANKFLISLQSESTHKALLDEIDFCRGLGIQGFPSLVVIKGSQARQIPTDYNNFQPMLDSIIAF